MLLMFVNNYYCINTVVCENSCIFKYRDGEIDRHERFKPS